jgi:trimeric autotransporter adhesin
MRMKIKVHLSVFILSVGAFGLFVVNKNLTQSRTSISDIDKTEIRYSLRDRIDLAMQQEFDRTKDPATGRVPRERLMLAYDVIRAQQSNKLGKAAISGITWNERGPSNVGGRTRAIIFDAKDVTNKAVFAGSVAGGLWKTTNIFADKVEWTSVNEFFGNMAVTSIAQDPSNANVLYFGTGEGYSNADAVRGDGIWKSTDGGSTWSQLSSTTGNNYDYVNKIIVDDVGNIVVGTKSQYINRGGIFRSIDGGINFSQVLDRYDSSGGSEYDRCADIELAADGKTYFAAMGMSSTDGIYKSTDSAKTWSLVYDADAVSEQRIELACAPSNSDYVYACVQGSGSGIKKIMKSTNGGTSWTTCTTISWYDQCSSLSTDFTRSQAWYDLIGVVDPNDEKTLIVAGINMFKTTDEGSTWSQLSSWVGCGGYSEVHSDHHALVYVPNSSDTLINGNDGGIYYTKDLGSSPPTFVHVNDGYNVTQFYAGAIHPDAQSNYFLTGAQDNGSQRFQYPGINNTDEVTGGDGAFCHIDQNQPDTQITAYVYNNIRVSTDGFATYTPYGSSVGNFINASDFDDVNNILYAGSSADRMYRWTKVGGAISGSDKSISALGGYQASAVLVSPSDPTIVYLGSEDGRVVKVTNANGGSPSGTSISSGLEDSVTVSCIAEDPRDSDHLLVTYSNYGDTSVYETTNGGTSWSAVEGDLPDMPVRWAMFSPWGSDSVLLATELGVWTTTNLNGNSTSWAATNTGLANCRVDMLQCRSSDSLIMAVTHGRGIYTTKFFSELVTPLFGAEKTIVYAGDIIQFYDDSYGATSWSWDFDNDGIYESTSQNPTYAFGSGGFKSVKLRINGNDSITKTDYIQVIPNQGTPYTTSDGGDMESNEWHFGGRIVSGGKQLWERGAPSNHFTSSYYNGSNAWVTDLDGDIPQTNIECELLTPNYNFSASGTYTLSFKKSMQYYASNAPFGVQLHYSTNKGETWTRLGTDATGTGWYDRGPSSASSMSFLIFGDGMAWNSNYTKSTASHDVSSLAGNENVCFRILFKNVDNYSSGVYDNRAGFLVDDFTISGPSNDSITGGGIENSIASKTIDIGPYDSLDFYSKNGKIIASIWNLSAHDFGPTTVEIDATGSSAIDFDTNTVTDKKIFSKTLKITPTTNNTDSSVKIATYYTEAELTGWKSATSRFAKNIQHIKTTNSIGSSTIAQGVHPSVIVLDSAFDGSNLCVIGTFSNGFSGVGSGGGVGGGSSPLPVTLLNFSGSRLAKNVTLKWVTASEFNNDHFDILRSVNNEPFKIIGLVLGSGNSSRIVEYSFVDTDAIIQSDNILCYRLKQVDFSEIFEYSNVICLINNNNQIDFLLRPNPVSKDLIVDINPWYNDLYTLDIYNLKGSLILSKKDLGSQNIFNFKNLAAGVYLVAIRQNGEIVKVERIVKSQ